MHSLRIRRASNKREELDENRRDTGPFIIVRARRLWVRIYVRTAPTFITGCALALFVHASPPPLICTNPQRFDAS